MTEKDECGACASSTQDAGARLAEEANASNEQKGIEAKRTRCEVYSRIVGYLRPVDQWNEGKRAEFEERKTYDIGENSACKTSA